MLTAANFRAGHQSGAAVIEFALVLPLLLAIAVGIVYYGYAFVLKTAVEHAAKNGALAAVAVSPLTAGYDEEVGRRARDAATDSLTWLPDSVTSSVVVTSGDDCSTSYGVTVMLRLNAVLPQFSLGRFRVPPLGGENSAITSKACVTL